MSEQAQPIPLRAAWVLVVARHRRAGRGLFEAPGRRGYTNRLLAAGRFGPEIRRDEAVRFGDCEAVPFLEAARRFEPELLPLLDTLGRVREIREPYEFAVELVFGACREASAARRQLVELFGRKEELVVLAE